MNKYFGYLKSPIGLLEIVATDKGLYEINFNAQKMSKEDDSHPIVQKTQTQLKEYFNQKRTAFDIPLDLDGTDFQLKVWRELINVPFGQVATYKDIALKADVPKAYRAVGHANNKNKIPIIIPCHRIIGSNGKLIGYAGGMDIKQWLLDHESQSILKD